MAQQESQTFKAENVLPGLLRAFLLVTVTKLRPLLRPSARNDLARYVGRLDSVSDAQTFLAWGQRLISAHMEDARKHGGSRAARVVSQTELPIFRRPDRAYRVRWLL